MADISIVDGTNGGEFSARAYRVEHGDVVNFINETIRPQLLVIDVDTAFVLSPKGLPGAVKTYTIQPDAPTIALRLPRVASSLAAATISVYQRGNGQG